MIFSKIIAISGLGLGAAVGIGFLLNSQGWIGKKKSTASNEQVPQIISATGTGQCWKDSKWTLPNWMKTKYHQNRDTQNGRGSDWFAGHLISVGKAHNLACTGESNDCNKCWWPFAKDGSGGCKVGESDQKNLFNPELSRERGEAELGAIWAAIKDKIKTDVGETLNVGKFKEGFYSGASNFGANWQEDGLTRCELKYIGS